MRHRLIVSLAVALAALAPLSARASAAAARPGCVVSLSPTATETLFAIGAGPQVKAVDKDSDYPAHGLPTKRVDSLNPSVEAIIGICPTSASHPSPKPDLVVISFDANTIKEKLTALGVKVVGPAPADDGRRGAGPDPTARGADRARGVGRRAGRVARRTIDGDVASVPAHPGKRLTVYYELDPTYYSLTSATFVGTLLKCLGVVNIADPESTTADAGYPQLSAEYIVSADPKLDLPGRHRLLPRVARVAGQAAGLRHGRRGHGRPRRRASTTTSRRAGGRASGCS